MTKRRTEIRLRAETRVEAETEVAADTEMTAPASSSPRASRTAWAQPPFKRDRSTMTPLLVLISISLLSLGCFTTSARMHSFADAIEQDLPDIELDHQFGVTLGRMSLGLVKGVAKWGVDKDDEAAFEIFRGVKKVEFATFEASGNNYDDFPYRLEESLEHKGWQTLARFREHGELGWIVYRMRNDKLKNVIVMTLEDEELTLVRLGGRLDKVLRAALAYSNQEIFDEDQERDFQVRETLLSQKARGSSVPGELHSLH